jgi:hypothetical protein
MLVLVRVVVGLFLAAHGLVHLLYLVTKEDDPGWPLSLKQSWLVPEGARRPLGLALLTGVVIAFVLLGLAVWGVPGLAPVWPQLAIAAASLSLALLVAFWNTELLVGVGIDIALIVLAALHPAWIDKIAG